MALLLAQQASAEVNVVVSIRPLQLLVAALLDEQDEIRVLVPESASPHHYVMTPGDRLALESADLIVYVGEELETELHSAIGGLDRDYAVLSLLATADLHKQALSGTNRLDPHIWLHSGNGVQIARVVRDRLVQIAPDLQPVLDQRLARLEEQLADRAQEWQSRIDRLPQSPYAVYHDAIGYFEYQFNRTHSIVLVDDPEIQPGIRHLVSVRRSIGETRPVCLFTDVTSRQNTINTLFTDHPVRQRELDLLGDRLPENGDYMQLIDGLVNDFVQCLDGNN